jgi:hypothetical protein
MGVALLKKDDGSDDPRSALREAIAARTVTHAKAELQRKAVERAHTMVRDAEARLTVVGEALEATRSGHAEALAQAASTGAAPTANGALRAARACQREQMRAKRAAERLTRVPKRTPARKQALAMGAKTYIGKVCPQGHDDGGGSVRYVISGCCQKCVQAMSRRRLTEEGRAHVRELERARDRRKTLALKTCIALGIPI